MIKKGAYNKHIKSEVKNSVKSCFHKSDLVLKLGPNK